MRRSGVRLPLVGFGPLHGECKGKTPKEDPMVQLARCDPYGNPMVVMSW